MTAQSETAPLPSSKALAALAAATKALRAAYTAAVDAAAHKPSAAVEWAVYADKHAAYLAAAGETST